MDTKPSEIQAENLIKHKLVKYNFLVTKPTFDKEGADLLIVKDISKKITPFVKIQCKGRTITTNSNVTIPKKYVEENFVVFLYVEVKESKEDFLYTYFQPDILKWNDLGEKWQLIIPKNFYKRDKFKNREFNKGVALQIENILLKQVINDLIRSHNSIVIDGIFLEKAVLKTKSFYQELYPDKEFKKPSIDELVFQFCRYGQVELNSDLNCYLIYSTDFGLEHIVEIGDLTVYDYMNGEIEKSVGSKYNLYKMKTDDFVSFKIEEQLERLINTENILLVADDPAYVPYLDILKDRGIEIKIIKMKGDFGSIMHHKFRYADVMYPIGIAIGLEKYEL